MNNTAFVSGLLIRMLLSPPAKAMVLKSTKDLSLEIAPTVSETETIFTLSPHLVSIMRNYNAYVTLLSNAH